VLRSVDFYRPAHEGIFEAILNLYGRGEPADAITVSDELSKRGDRLVARGVAPIRSQATPATGRTAARVIPKTRNSSGAARNDVPGHGFVQDQRTENHGHVCLGSGCGNGGPGAFEERCVRRRHRLADASIAGNEAFRKADEAGALEDLEVPRDGRLGHMEWGGQLGNAIHCKPHGANDWLYVVVQEAVWTALANRIGPDVGVPDLANDPRVATIAERRKNQNLVWTLLNKGECFIEAALDRDEDESVGGPVLSGGPLVSGNSMDAGSSLANRRDACYGRGGRRRMTPP